MTLGHAQGRRPRAGLYFGKGAVDSLQQHVASCKPETCVSWFTCAGPVQLLRPWISPFSAADLRCHLRCRCRVVVNATLNGVQHRNLEQALG